MSKEHDDCVLQVADAVSDLGAVYVDLPATYVHGHKKDKKELTLSKSPPPMCLAAFVPAQAVFTSYQVVPNFDWHKPDVVVVAKGLRYVVDVYDDNDSYSGIVRKIEAVIASAPADKIVGLALVEKGSRTPFRGALDKLKNLRESFWAVVGGQPEGDPDDPVTYLRALLRKEAVSKAYGEVDWDSVLQVVIVSENNWQQKLVAHARSRLEGRAHMSRSVRRVV